VGKKIRKGAAKVRKQLGMFHDSQNVMINVKELKKYLDRLEKLERREAKRKARKAKAKAAEAKALTGEIKTGDRVELVEDLQTWIWPFMVKGAQGTVESITGAGSHNYLINLDNSTKEFAQGFSRHEIRKIA
jgi:hypothetical protein